jgi:hypothetical protein
LTNLRKLAPAAAGLALLAAFVLVARGLYLLHGPGPTAQGWLWTLGAALLAALAFFSLQLREGEQLPADRPARFQPVTRLGLAALLLLAGLVLAGIALVNLARFGNHQEMRWLWIASLALLVLGSAMLGALGPGSSRQAPAKTHADRRGLLLELLGFLALVALAVWLRIDRLDQMPPGIFVDETNAALDAIRIMEGSADSPFGTGWFETPTMYAFYLVGLFRLLGTTFLALKAASLIPAILTVAAVYPLARLMFGVPTAFAATFLLATNRWHLTMSRWGWNEVAPLLFLIGAVYFLQRAVRDRRASDFALAGLLLGLGHYTYLASRLVVIAVVLYLLYRILCERGFLRGNWRGLVLALVLYLVAFGPLLLTYVQNPFSLLNRSQQVSILHDMRQAAADGQSTGGLAGSALRSLGLAEDISLRPLGESIRRHLEMFHVWGDRNPRHNLPGEPMLDPVTGGLLLLALGFALGMLFRPRGVGPGRESHGMAGGHRYALLLLWLSVPLLGGILTRLDEAPQAYRTLPVVGAIVLLAGDAAVRSARVFASALSWPEQAGQSKWLRAAPAVAMAALLAWAAVVNYQLFFNVQARDGQVWQAFSPVETTVATEVASKMDDHSLFLSPRLYYFSPVRYLTYRPPEAGGGLDRPAYRMAEPVTDLPLNDPFGQDALFLLDVYYQDIPELFLSLYPNTSFELVEGPGGQPLYLSVTVPGEDIVSLQGLQGEYVLAAGQEPEILPYDGAPRFLWPPELVAQANPEATARWAGSLQVPSSGLVNLQVDGPGRVIVDGQPWDAARFLAKGLHNLQVEQTAPGTAATITLSWQLPGMPAEPIPPNHFFQVGPSEFGLRGEYYQGELWEGQPVFSRIDPLLLFAWPEAEPWSGPFSARWTGSLLVPEDGTYRFQLLADDGVRLWVEDRLAGESVNPDTVNSVDVSLPLSAGPHSVRVDYFQRGGGKALEFWWQPPGQDLQPVPPQVLRPVP